MSASSAASLLLRGSMPALVTPFKDGAVDDVALQGLVEWQISEGSHGLVACGTTGESPCLTREEHLRVVRLVAEAAAGRVPVIAGASSNSTDTAISLARDCAEAGADALLVVAPYYNKPTQEGLFRHFEAVASGTDLPLVVYNVPGRTVSDVKPETLARLARHPNIVAVKDASADLARVSLHRRSIGPDFTLLSGEDATALGFMAHGGHGCISVTANVAPGLCAALMDAAMAGDYAAALARQDALIDLHTALFLETSPAPTKYALSILGKCLEDLRLPLVPVGDATRQAVRAALAAADIAHG